MSKKKFTTGLESLFGDPSEKAFQQDSALMDVEEKSTRRTAKKRDVDKDASSAKRSSKDFTSDLETLFEQAISETIEEKLEQENQKKAIKKRARKLRSRPLSGLDALIRRTGDMDYVEVNVPTKKRVTFVFDKKKLEQLKQIAKSKKLYLKDIIGDVMSNFIEKYETEGGEIA